MRQAAIYANNVYAWILTETDFGQRIGMLPKELESVISVFSQNNPSYQERWHRFLRKSMVKI